MIKKISKLRSRRDREGSEEQEDQERDSNGQKVDSDYYVRKARSAVQHARRGQIQHPAYHKHLIELYMSFKTIKNSGEGLRANDDDCSRLQPKATKIICFDLDQTLVHTVAEEVTHDAKIEITVEGKQLTLFVLIRPFAREVLSRLAAHFQIVVFTASIEEYAEKVVALLDPERKVVTRIYHRKSCRFVAGKHVKELSAVDEDLRRLVLVDNSLNSFALNLSNGVPITSYYNDSEDRELLEIEQFLMGLRQSGDVRRAIAGHFDFKWLYEGEWLRSFQGAE